MAKLRIKTKKDQIFFPKPPKSLPRILIVNLLLLISIPTKKLVQSTLFNINLNQCLGFSEDQVFYLITAIIWVLWIIFVIWKDKTIQRKFHKKLINWCQFLFLVVYLLSLPHFAYLKPNGVFINYSLFKKELYFPWCQVESVKTDYRRVTRRAQSFDYAYYDIKIKNRSQRLLFIVNQADEQRVDALWDILYENGL